MGSEPLWNHFTRGTRGQNGVKSGSKVVPNGCGRALASVRLRKILKFLPQATPGTVHFTLPVRYGTRTSSATQKAALDRAWEWCGQGQASICENIYLWDVRPYENGVHWPDWIPYDSGETVQLPKKILSLLPNNQTILIFVWSFGPDAILYSFFTVWLKRIVRRVRFGT